MADSKANPELDSGDQHKSKLGMTEALVDAAADRIPDDLAPYNSEIMERMSGEQKDLYRDFVSATAARARYLDEETREVFRFGGALVYDALPKAVRDVPLTEQQRETAKRSLVDSSHLDEEGMVDVTWFVKKLEDESLLLELLADVAGGLFEGDYKRQGEFLFGAILVAMPFYMRVEASEMEQRLYGSGDKV